MDCIKIKEGTSLIRVLNSLPQVNAIDVYINKRLAISNLQYKQFSNYITLPEGDYRIDVFVSQSTDQSIISGSLDLEDGQILTIASIGNIGDLGLLVISDHVDKEVIHDKSAFRIVQLSPNLPSVNVLVNNKDLVEGLEYKQNISYVDARPNQYTIDLYLTENNVSVLSFGAVLKPNRIYTLYIVGEYPDLSAIQSVDVNTYLCR
ncbi:DUF4397 domain-containing protein [Romboutsia sp. Marseille-P6047]|uniref:DUF4397 domain-containing protein n=1 Tax=Romboutsia sp. Marseille-P6047 TaxID=2161817 RepID=UPI000F0580C0|nr:DUF4397 domain-containing protein [Romboutsia sp. Marseille-P6047]